MEQLSSHFHSKVAALLSEAKDGEEVREPEFTEGAKEKVLLASYPRSGNTLIRSYLEKITGIITGSDHIIDLKLNRDLFELGMTGEGRIDDTVWIVKSHYPERLGHTPLNVNRCILMVRSPFDSLWSFFNMMATQSHNQSIHPDKVPLMQDMWEQFVEDELRTWKEFHEYWISTPQKVPTYIIRYEDLLSQPQATMQGLFKFLLNKDDSLDGTSVEQIIKQVSGRDKPEVYKPRSGKINGSMEHFSEKQIEYIRNEIYPYLQKFGYLKAREGQGHNPTGFVDPLPEEDSFCEKYKDKDWLSDFNNKMLFVSVRLRLERFPDEAQFLERVSTLISDRKEVERYKEKKGKGWRANRQKIKDVMNL